MFIQINKSNMHEFQTLLTYSHVSEISNEAKNKLLSIVEGLSLFEDFYKVARLTVVTSGTFRILCYKNSEKNLSEPETRTSGYHQNTFYFFQYYDPFVGINCFKLYLSLCSTDESVNYLIEIYLLDKSMHEIAYYDILLELMCNHNLAMMLLTSTTLLACRAKPRQISDVLDMNDSLKSIIIRDCHITSDSAKVLSSNLIKINTLEHFIIENTSIDTLLPIIDGLKTLSQLKCIILADINLLGKVVNDLADVIKINTCLEEVHLQNNKLHSTAVVILQALKGTSNLKILDLINNNMSGRVVDDLADVIKCNTCLEELHLYNNNLQLSAVEILQELKRISSLKKLDLNSNTLSEKVANDLADVIKSNTCLEELHLENNNLQSSAIVILKSLKLTTNLRKLNLNGNNISKKVVHDLAEVIKHNTCLEELYLGGNNLQPSAVIVLHALKGISSLRKLSLNSNNMSEKVVDDLADVIKNNTCLEELYLDSNNLQSFTVVILQALKQLWSLKKLSLNNNNMSNEVVYDLADVIKHNFHLEELSLDSNDLQSSMAIILHALKKVSNLKKLNLNNIRISKNVLIDLADVIKCNTCLEELHLFYNNLQSSAVVILHALKQISSLKKLNLNSNYMSEEVVDDLADVIKRNTGLQELHLDYNFFQSSTVVVLQALKTFYHLQKLNLNCNYMSEEVVHDLADVISNNNCLEELQLYNNNLGSSAVVILQALTRISGLTVLNLSCNNMSENVVNDLASVIKNNPYIEELFLDHNNLQSPVVVVLQALKRTSHLKNLNLNGNNMSAKVVNDLADAIKSNTSLEELHLFSNDLQSSAVVILQALKEISTLTKLNLNSNNMSGKVVNDLADAIKSNTYLEELYLGCNNLQSLAADILQALREISTLKILDLGNNNMSGKVVNCLADVIKSNTCLEELYLDYNNLQSTATVILQALQGISTLQKLNLNGNNMSENVVDNLAIVIKNNACLEEIHLFENNFGSSVIVSLQVLKENPLFKNIVKF